MTGSLDALACRYAAVARNQTHRQETIADAEAMVDTLLKEYHKACKITPQRIFYMRDGVSEGQFAQILEVELPAIRRAAAAFTKGVKPVTISVIIAKKRHHTRFFPDPPTSGDNKGNVFPGTVVDTGVVHPIEFDFCILLSDVC